MSKVNDDGEITSEKQKHIPNIVSINNDFVLDYV